MTDATPNATDIDWQAIEAALLALPECSNGVTVNFTPPALLPQYVTANAQWFVGNGDIEGFGATLADAVADYCNAAQDAQ